MSVQKTMGDQHVMQRRAIPNPKYNSVRPVVESGMTTQLAEYMRESQIKTKQQPGEFFKRIRTSAIAKPFQHQQHSIVLDDGGFATPMDEYGGAQNGTGQAEVVFLLLDCRELDQYQSCHIHGALHYPKVKLNHATNPFLPEMFAVKNKDHKWIVLYDLEEEAVVSFANALFQKGVDNVAVMSGGLREFAQDFSTFLTGPSPVPIIPRDLKMQRRADEATLARSEARSTTSRKPKSLSNSLARPTRRSAF